MTITYELVEGWVQAGASESQTLEFKAILPPGNPESKQEFLKDVSAMANSEGGTIVYGVSEQAGQASNVLPIVGEIADAVKRRLGQMAQSGIEPRIPRLDFHVLEVPNGGFVLAVVVARSFVGPHRVSSNNTFYLRSASHIAQFSYSQLRDAFTLRSHAEDRMRQWRATRLALIKGGRTPRPLLRESRYVIHVQPLASFAGDIAVDVTMLENQGGKLLFGRLSSYGTYFNLDGLVAASYFSEKEDNKYVQLFRNGALETAGFIGLTMDDRKIIPADFIASELRSALDVQLTTLISLGISGPVAIAVTWLSVQNYSLGISNHHMPATDRDDLELPEIVAESIVQLSQDVDVIAKPILDTLWQCFGQATCPLYDKDGRWKLPGQY